MTTRQTERRGKSKLRRFTAIASAIIVASIILLAHGWIRLERMSFHFDWNQGVPISANLFQFGRGQDLCLTHHADPDKPGHVRIIYRLWYIGPSLARRVVYQRPGTEAG
jgi:hypothetical protein